MSATTFLLPSILDKSEKNEVESAPGAVMASEGFAFNRNGTYVFVTSIEKVAEGALNHIIGFTSSKTFDSGLHSGQVGRSLSGTCLSLTDGNLYGGTGHFSTRWTKPYFSPSVAKTAREIISILTISTCGIQRWFIQFIALGNGNSRTEGHVQELARINFENNGGNEIFAVAFSDSKKQKIVCIPFNQVKCRSPKIDELMNEFLCSENNNGKEQESKTKIKKTTKKVAVVKRTKTTTKKAGKKKAGSKKKKTLKKATKKAGKKIAKN